MPLPVTPHSKISKNGFSPYIAIIMDFIINILSGFYQNESEYIGYFNTVIKGITSWLKYPNKASEVFTKCTLHCNRSLQKQSSVVNSYQK